MTTTTKPMDDGGPAFPRDHRHLGHNGMSLRDYFAARALTGMLSNPINNDVASDDFASSAYALADAMLRARQENSNG